MPSREATAFRPHIFQATTAAAAAAFSVTLPFELERRTSSVGRPLLRLPLPKVERAIPNLRYRRVMTDNVGRNGPRRFLRLQASEIGRAAVEGGVGDGKSD